MKQAVMFFLCSSAMLAAPLYAENFVRNSDFSMGTMFNGSKSLMTGVDSGVQVRSFGKKATWYQPVCSGWHVELPQGKKCDVQRGQNNDSLIVSGECTVKIEPSPLHGHEAVLSLDVRTKDANGTVFADLVNPKAGFYSYHVLKTEKTALPVNTNGKYQRITISVAMKGKDPVNAGLRIKMTSGSVEIARVQIEPGTKATSYEPRPQEWLSVKFDNFGLENLPRFYQDGDNVPKAGKRKIIVCNHSNHDLTGTLTFYLDTYPECGKTKIHESKIKKLAPGEEYSFRFEPGKLSCNAYVLAVELKKDGKVIVSKDGIFAPKNTASGVVGQHMLQANNAMRFAVFPPVLPKDIFGVGNGMVGQGQWWGGYQVKNFLMAREIKLEVSGGGNKEEDFYYGAIEGCQMFGDTWIDTGNPNRPEMNNPAGKNMLDVYHPDSKKLLEERALELGKKFAAGPGPAAVKMRNESAYLNGGHVCPTEAADAAFREWCREKHGTLEKLNERWGTKYTSWDQVEQIVSARMANSAKSVEKTGAAAIDWFANMGRFDDKVVTLMDQSPAQAMDWCRWRSQSGLAVYLEFYRNVHKVSGDTLVGTNFCWPNFWSHIVMPFWRGTDAPMMDMQYTAGMTKDLGNSDEMIDMIEMAESTVPGKPLWGIEIYIQPGFPDDFPAFQNWGMVAHGMTANMVFGWEPYSDAGQGVFKAGPKSWLNPKAPPMWMMIDTDGTKLPLWDSNARSVKEIADFHKAYNGFSLKRLKSRVGWYIPNDTAEYIVMQTANKPYCSGIMHSRVCTAAGLRLHGVTMNYLDDDAVLNDNLSRTLDTILVPFSPVMREEALAKLAAFAKKGGTVVFIGPCAVYDPWLRTYDSMGGPAFASLKMIPPLYWKDRNSFKKDVWHKNRDCVYVCKNMPLPENGKRAEKLADATTVEFGKGRVVFSTSFPCRYMIRNGVHESPVMDKWMNDLIAEAKLPLNGIWIPGAKESKMVPAKVGSGAPLVEVVIREKSSGERFAFVLNQGGEGSGVVRLPGKWTITDALTKKDVSVKHTETDTEIAMTLKPFGYRVLRMTRNVGFLESFLNLFQ